MVEKTVEKQTTPAVVEIISDSTSPDYGLVTDEKISTLILGERGKLRFRGDLKDLTGLSEKLTSVASGKKFNGFGVEWFAIENLTNAKTHGIDCHTGKHVELEWDFTKEEGTVSISNPNSPFFNPIIYVGRSGQQVEDEVGENNAHVGLAGCVRVTEHMNCLWDFGDKGKIRALVKEDTFSTDKNILAQIKYERIKPNGEVTPWSLEIDKNADLARKYTITGYFKKVKKD